MLEYLTLNNLKKYENILMNNEDLYNELEENKNNNFFEMCTEDFKIFLNCLERNNLKLKSDYHWVSGVTYVRLEPNENFTNKDIKKVIKEYNNAVWIIQFYSFDNIQTIKELENKIHNELKNAILYYDYDLISYLKNTLLTDYENKIIINTVTNEIIM